MEKSIIIILGSDSDRAVVEKGLCLLEEMGIPYLMEVISAHRQPDKLRDFCKGIKKDGQGKVIIACAGLSAALPGFVAAYTDLPVIGVPLDAGNFKGLESLLAIAEVPKGLGLVSTGVGGKGFLNAIIFAVKILSMESSEYAEALKKIRLKMGMR